MKTTRLVNEKDTLFEEMDAILVPVTECCKIGPITLEKFCSNCGAQIYVGEVLHIEYGPSKERVFYCDSHKNHPVAEECRTINGNKVKFLVDDRDWTIDELKNLIEILEEK